MIAKGAPSSDAKSQKFCAGNRKEPGGYELLTLAISSAPGSLEASKKELRVAYSYEAC